jgi:hypothetical protein
MAQVLSKLAQVHFTKNVGIGTAWMRVKGSRQTCLMHRTVDNGKHLLEVRKFKLLDCNIFSSVKLKAGSL